MSATPPDALLVTAPECPHCASVKRGLDSLLKQGVIGTLTVIDATTNSERVKEYGVRTTPWLRLGPFTLTGAHSPSELKQWAEWANGEDGIAHYVEHLLKQGSYKQAVAFIEADAQRLKPLLAIVANPQARIQVRLGVSALLEAYANAPELQRLLPQLAELTRHPDHRIRADACHLLGLTGSPEARPPLEACVSDAHEEVREIATDALDALKTSGTVLPGKTP